MALSAPSFNTRVPVQFICTDSPTLSISTSNNNLLQNNPQVFNVNSGAVTKSDPGMDGVNHIRGTVEYAPFSLDLQWKQLSMTDYLKLAGLNSMYVHFISYRNIGYYGRLLLEGPKSAGIKTADVVSLKGVFLPMAPSDQGGAQAVNRIAAPTSLTISQGAAGSGFIANGSSNYYWFTFSSKYGESTPYAAPVVTASADKVANTITWSWSSSAYCEWASIYVANVNDATQAKLIGEVPNGLSATWVDYVGYQGTLINRQPPTVNTAYRGEWKGGVWFNET